MSVSRFEFGPTIGGCEGVFSFERKRGQVRKYINFDASHLIFSKYRRRRLHLNDLTGMSHFLLFSKKKNIYDESINQMVN